MITIRVRPGVGAGSSDAIEPGRPGDPFRPRAQRPGVGSEADTVDLDKIQEFASQMGLDIIELSPARRSVVLWGTASAITAAFRVELAHYDYAGAVRRGQIGPVHLPPTIAHLVEEVSGLDDGLPDPMPAAVPPQRPRPVIAGQVVIAIGAFLIGGALSVLLLRGKIAEHFVSPPVSSSNQIVASRPANGVPQNAVTQAPRATMHDLQAAEIEAAAWKSLDAGHVREAQDYFLRALTLDPGRRTSMRGLVAVRRKMAGDNPRVARQQAAVYQDAVKRGVSTDDFYSPSALQVLITASLTAAEELEAQQAPAPSAASAVPPAPSAPPRTPAPSDQGSASGKTQHPVVITAKPPAHETVPTGGKLPQAAVPAKAAVPPPSPPAKPVDQPPAPSPQKPAAPQKPIAASAPVLAPTVPPTQAPSSSTVAAAPAPSPVSPPPAPRPATAVGTGAPAAPSNRLYMVRIGPLTDRDRAAAVAKQLSAGGLPQPQITTQTGYRVLSEPLPRQDAEKLAGTLAARGFHTYTVALAGDTVQLIFGGFASQKDAEALSGRIAAAGYDAWVRTAPLYTIHLGPYPEATVTAITDVVRAHAPEAAVATDDAPAQASSGPPAAAPAVSPSVPAASPPAAAPPQAASPPAAAVPATVAPASPAASNSLYTVRIGPVSDRDRAAAVAKQLSAGGFAQSQITSQTGYRVVSEPLPRKVAEDLVGTLAARGLRSYVEPLTGDSVQLLFGIFAARKDAEALSSRIAAAGYDAWIREGAVYTLRLGPYPQASVNTITGIVRAGAPEANIASDPVSTP